MYVHTPLLPTLTTLPSSQHPMPAVVAKNITACLATETNTTVCIVGPPNTRGSPL